MSIIVPSTIIIPISVALVNRKYWKASQRLSFYYLLLAAVFNIIATVTAGLNINNLPGLHLYTVLEFILLCLLLKSFFQKPFIKKTLTALIFLFPLLAVVYICFIGSIFTYNTLPRFAESMSLSLFCLYFLIQDLNNTTDNQANFNFTIVIGLLLYLCSTSTLFGASNYIIRHFDKHLYKFIWNIHATLVMLMYFIFAFAFYHLKKKEL